MIKNFFLISLRNLWKRKFFSLLNILGFAFGIASCLLILQYVRYELGYDKFHENKSVYRIRYDRYQDGELSFKSARSFPSVGKDLKEEFPEVKEYVRISHFGSSIVAYNDRIFSEEKIYFADPAFFDFFSFPIIKGTKESFNKINNIFITETVAQKYFDDSDPVGKTLTIGKSDVYVVAGILKDIPSNSHLNFNILVPLGEMENNWDANFVYTYVDIPQGNPQELEAKFPAFIEKHKGDLAKENRKDVFLLQSVQDIHLKSNLIEELSVNGDEKNVFFLIAISFFIILIACINYINLSTAQGMERAKEVGIRKTLGATNRNLFFQFIFESVIINIIALIISLIIIKISLPYFIDLVEKPLAISISDFTLVMMIIIIFLIGSILSGIYPAIVLSSFLPEKVLKGKLEASNQGFTLRKALVVFQFSASVALIIATITIFKQLRFMKQKDLGINISKKLVIHEPFSTKNDSLFLSSFSNFSEELKRHSAIQSVSTSSLVPGFENEHYVYEWLRKPNSATMDNNTYYTVYIDEHFIPNYEVQLIAGRNFSADHKTDKNAMILNEAAVQLIGLGPPDKALNQILFGGIKKPKEYHVIGVIKNYSQQSVKKSPEPMLLFYNTLKSGKTGYYTIKLNNTNVSEAITTIKKTWENAFPNKPFDYFFLDDFFNEQYKDEMKFGTVYGSFSFLAIIISALGLFALSSFTALQKTKEVSIRKILGANSFSILMLLTKDFMKLVLIANLIAWPLMYFILNKWLENYASRIDLGIGIFLIAGISSIIIALLSVSYFTIKTINTDPADSLRNE